MERDALLEAAQVLFLGDEEEIADLLEAGVDAELLAEILEHPEALEREADLRLGGELGADAARGLAGGAAAHRLALEDDHVTHVPASEVIGNAAADHAATDDDYACCFGLVHG